MHKRWRKGEGGEGKTIHLNFLFFHLCFSVFQLYSGHYRVSCINSLPFSLSLLFSEFSSSITLCLYLHPSFSSWISSETSLLIYQPLPFTVAYSFSHSIFVSRPLLIIVSFDALCSSSSLTSVCLSLSFPPFTVVLVDYVIRAEDMSFFSTRFTAQHDYTKPHQYSLYLSHIHTLTQTSPSSHIHGLLNVPVIDLD